MNLGSSPGLAATGALIGQATLVLLALSIAGAVAEPVEAVGGSEPLNPLAAIDRQTLAGFRDRPLFTTSRRPPPAPAIAAPAAVAVIPAARAPSPPPKLHLLGVMQAGATHLALLRVGEGGKTVTLRSGDTLGEWTILIVSSKELRLTRDDENVVFRLFGRGNAFPVTDSRVLGLKSVPIPSPGPSMIDRNNRLRSRSY